MKKLALPLAGILFSSAIIDHSPHMWPQRTPSSITSGCADLALNIISNSGLRFPENIDHPSLYLWDNFGYIDQNGTRHLYSMAADRNLNEIERHFYAHWRHFTSEDAGKSWVDRGSALAPNKKEGSFDTQSIWSGTVTQLKDGRVVALYTGLESAQRMKQSIGIAVSQDGFSFNRSATPLLSHEINRADWKRAGYYIDEVGNLGDINGEIDGTIQALRDPFPLETSDGELHIFFAAKMQQDNGAVSAIGHALIKDKENLKDVKLLPPIVPPDTALYNQIELPNVVEYEPGKFTWIISTKRRLSEEQPELETEPAVRMYFSDGLDAPLSPYKHENSLVMDGRENGLYGMTVVSGSLADGSVEARLFVVAPGFEHKPFSLPETQRIRIIP